MSVKNIKHGHATRKKRSITYTSWSGMKARCSGGHSEKSDKLYFNRGITYPKKWEKFDNFLKDMGERPHKKMSLDRIDNSKGYSKKNCRWVTNKVQCNNRRSNRVFNFCGEKLNIQQASEKFNISYNVLIMRLRRGWPPDKAVSIKPVKNANQKTYGDIKNASKYA